MQDDALTNTPEKTERDLLEFIRSQLIDENDAVFDANTLLFEDGFINSINILTLIGFVEHRLGRRLEDGEIRMAGFRSVRSIVREFFHA